MISQESPAPETIAEAVALLAEIHQIPSSTSTLSATRCCSATGEPGTWPTPPETTAAPRY